MVVLKRQVWFTSKKKLVQSVALICFLPNIKIIHLSPVEQRLELLAYFVIQWWDPPLSISSLSSRDKKLLQKLKKNKNAVKSVKKSKMRRKLPEKKKKLQNLKINISKLKRKLRKKRRKDLISWVMLTKSMSSWEKCIIKTAIQTER